MNKILLLITVLTMISCTEEMKSGSKENVDPPIVIASRPDSITIPEEETNEFAGKLYLLGQGFGETSCVIENACDCCNSNLLFISSDEFVLNELCEGSESVVKGNYVVKGKSLALNYEPLIVNYNYNWESEVDSTAVEFTFNIERKEIPASKYKIEKCKGETLIALRSKKGDELGMFDATSTNEAKIQDLKEKGIWQKLELK